MHLARQFAGTRNDALQLSEKPGIAFLAIILALHICCFLALFSGQAHAVKAAPQPVVVLQPDGTEVTIYLKGDEYLHWNEDENGFAVVMSADGQSWVYAREESGRLVPTSHIVGRVDPLSVGLSKPDIARMRAAIQPRPMLQTDDGVQKAPAAGSMKNLVVLVNFSDLAITRSTLRSTAYSIRSDTRSTAPRDP